MSAIFIFSSRSSLTGGCFISLMEADDEKIFAASIKERQPPVREVRDKLCPNGRGRYYMAADKENRWTQLLSRRSSFVNRQPLSGLIFSG